ncbi:hypothetical protein LOZ58_004231 [Ophidiomyces ophidiicola]|nr:hypothetical protein LOZ58_004231 [Ophidiomyces ophidiicola]
MDSIIKQIRELHTQADEDGRRQINNELGKLHASLDTDWDVVLKLAGGPLQLGLVKIGADFEIFKALSERTHTISELVDKTGIPSDMLIRFLRGQASFGMIKEEGTEGFSANRITRLYAEPNVSGAITYTFDILRPIAHTLPSFLKDRRNTSITSTYDTVFQKAFNTTQPGFEWMSQHPEHIGNLFKFLALRPNRDWVDSFPIEKELESFNEPNKTILVDIGGSTGDQAVLLKKKFPHAAGRIVVQDIPTTLIHAKPIEGIEFMEYDCFKPQPVKGAKFYYLRYVMHLWQDDKCVEALKTIVPAMGPDSKILIDEVVVPASDVPWQAACQSILMNSALAGAERTLVEWQGLLQAAGLQIVDIFTYDTNMQSIIMVVPKN